MPKSVKSALAVLSMLTACQFTQTALAQQAASPLAFSASTSLLTSGAADMGSNNDIQWTRGMLQAELIWNRAPQQSIGVELALGGTHYDFGNAVLGQSDLDIGEATLALPVRTPAWQGAGLFFSPQLSFAGEDGVDFEDGLTYGAVAGVAWQMTPDLMVGPGVGVFSTFEGSDDDVAFMPFLVFNWQFHEDWSLSTGAGSVAVRGPSLRLAYQASDALQVGLEAGYEAFEFRLSDSHQVSGGVGEQSNIPVALTANYAPTENLTLSGSLGAAFNGRLEFKDKNGNEVFSESHDITPTFGFRAKLDF